VTVGVVKPDHLNPGTTAALSVTVINAGNIDVVCLLQGNNNGVAASYFRCTVVD
jgi:uncharacterized cupredoxin-like copper-binding protein